MVTKLVGTKTHQVAYRIEALAHKRPSGGSGNTDFARNEPFSRYGQKRHRSEERREQNRYRPYLGNRSTKFKVRGVKIHPESETNSAVASPSALNRPFGLKSAEKQRPRQFWEAAATPSKSPVIL